MAQTITHTPTNTSNLLLNPRVYWRISAIALLSAAALGFILNLVAGNNTGIGSFLVFDWMHNSLHLFLGIIATVFGFGTLSPQLGKTMAIVFGFVYGGLGVVGLMLGQFNLLPGLHVELGENLIHIALGAWALTAGFVAKYE